MGLFHSVTPEIALEMVCNVMGVEYKVGVRLPIESGIKLETSTVPGDWKVLVQKYISPYQINLLNRHFNVSFYATANKIVITKRTITD